MTPDEFWKIVDKSARSDEPEETLRRSLSRLTAKEIAAFDALFYRFVDEAMTWDLWGAAYLAMGGCSEDGFEYARRGMVARGRKFYDRVIANPDALARLDDPEDIENEEIGAVASDVYEEKTGKPPPRLRRRAKPAGRRWDFEDANECAKRLPKLFAITHAADSRTDEEPARAKPSSAALAAGNRQLFDTMVGGAWEREASNVDAAIELYESALAFIGDDESSPMFPLAHRNVAHHYVNRGDVKRARPHIEAALRTKARLEGMLPYLARVEAAGAWFLFRHSPKRIDEALALARSAQRRPGIDRDTLLSALDTEMRVLLKRKRTADALVIARRGQALDPNDEDFAEVLSRFGSER